MRFLACHHYRSFKNKIPLLKLPWTTQKMKILGFPQSSITEVIGRRKTPVYSQTETPAGAAQGLALADCGLALESYRTAPTVRKSLRPSLQKLAKYPGITSWKTQFTLQTKTPICVLLSLLSLVPPSLSNPFQVVYHSEWSFSFIVV